MTFNYLYRLIYENNNQDHLYFSNIEGAYKIYFDLDENDLIETEKKALDPPDYAHNLLAFNIEFYYKKEIYKIYHTLYHYKISQNSFKDLIKSDDIEDSMNILKGFNNIPLTPDIFNKKNSQVKTVVSIYKIDTNKKDMFNHFNRIDLGRFRFFLGIADIVQKVKEIIDQSDNSGGEKEDLPIPQTPGKNKPVFV
jgi:predicted nucleotide-binding protein (sugar kinase/HSP70/actin superfamily)